MTEEELLTYAAKLVNGRFSPGTMRHKRNDSWDDVVWSGPMGMTGDCFDGFGYPQTDDGDAWRLALCAGIHVTPSRIFNHVSAAFWKDWQWVNFKEEIGNDIYAAARRVILRTAAEMGKKLP